VQITATAAQYHSKLFIKHLRRHYEEKVIMKKNNVNVPNRDAKRTTFSCILKKNSHTYSYGLVTPWCVITVFSSSFNPLT